MRFGGRISRGVVLALLLATRSHAINTDVPIVAPYNLIQNSSTDLTRRSTLNVVGNGLMTCADGSAKTNCTVSLGTSLQYLRTNSGATATEWATLSVDHGALTGLSDDDHSQYGLLAGRTGATNNPILSTTVDGILTGSTQTSKGLVLRPNASTGPELSILPVVVTTLSGGFFGRGVDAATFATAMGNPSALNDFGFFIADGESSDAQIGVIASGNSSGILALGSIGGTFGTPTKSGNDADMGAIYFMYRETAGTMAAPAYINARMVGDVDANLSRMFINAGEIRLTGGTTLIKPGNNYTLEVSTGGYALLDNTNNTANALRFAEPSDAGTHYTAVKAQAQSADLTYTLPASITTDGFLKTSSGGTLTWSTLADADVPDTLTLTASSITSGALAVARGGTGAAPGGDDQLIVADSTSAATWRTLTDCTGAGKAVTYVASSNTFGCNTAANGSNCSAGQAPEGVDASGAVEGCFTVATASSTTTFTNKTFTLLRTVSIGAAACTSDTAASSAWDLRGSSVPAAACVTGGNGAQVPVLDFDAAADECKQISFKLPLDADPSLGFDVVYEWFSAAATSGAAGWCSQFVCVADSESTNPSFPAHSSSNCASFTTDGTAGDLNQDTDTAVTNTGCAGGEQLYWRLCRDGDGSTVTDSLVGDAREINATLVYRAVKVTQ